MTQRSAAAVLLLALAASLPSAHAQDGAALERLGWLAGCWADPTADAGSGEHWMPLAGGSLLGVSRTVKQARTVSYEFMRIAAGSDGRIAFFAQPSGKAPDAFPVLRQADREIVFENLAHPFPQRIVYRFEPPDRLQARIEGMRDGVARAIDYPMVRIACDDARHQKPKEAP